MGLQVLGVQQLSGQHGLFGEFIRIEGGDALLGGAELLIGQPGFLQTIQITMPGHQQRGSVADFQVFGGQGHALGLHFLHFFPEVFRVQGHAVAQDLSLIHI